MVLQEKHNVCQDVGGENYTEIRCLGQGKSQESLVLDEIGSGELNENRLDKGEIGPITGSCVTNNVLCLCPRGDSLVPEMHACVDACEHQVK